MNWGTESLLLGRAWGVQVRVSKLLLVLGGIHILSGYAFYGVPVASSLVEWAAILLAITLHECAHLVTASRLGLRPFTLLIHPLGGQATMQTPSRPWDQVAISLAGPGSNLLVALCLLGVHHAFGPGSATPLPWTPSLFHAFEAVLRWNLFIGAFNLLPAWPLDGGWALEAALRARRPAWVPFSAPSGTVSLLAKLIHGVILVTGLVSGDSGLALIGALLLAAVLQREQGGVAPPLARHTRSSRPAARAPTGGRGTVFDRLSSWWEERRLRGLRQRLRVLRGEGKDESPPPGPFRIH